MRVVLSFTAIVLALLIGLHFIEQPTTGQPFKDLTVVLVYPEDDERDIRATINSAVNAAQADLGCKVEPIFTPWTSEDVSQAVRQMASAFPTGICIMGYPADENLLADIEEALDQNIVVTSFNSHFPAGEQRASGEGFGYAGIDGYKAAYALGKEAIRKHDLQPGDTALIFGDIEHAARTPWRDGCLAAFEEGGLSVTQYEISVDSMMRDSKELIDWLAELAANDQLPDVAFFTEIPMRLAASMMNLAGIERDQINLIGIGLNAKTDVDSLGSRGWGRRASLIVGQDVDVQAYLAILQVCMSRTLTAPGMQINLPFKIIGDASSRTPVFESNDRRFVQLN